MVLPAPVRDVTESLAEAASLLRLKVPELNRIVGAGQPVPLTRLPTQEEATLVENKLRSFGIESVTVPNEALRLEVAARKIRGLEVANDSLTASTVGSGEELSARWEEVLLIISGRLVMNRIEVEERKRRGRKQMVDSRQLSADESVLDLYSASDEAGWRINANSFDFSCLGSMKSVTSFENFTALINLLRERATMAQFDESYLQARPALATVWPLEQQTRKGDWRRSGAGKFDLATVTTTDNETQFTRYSRLRHQLRLRDLADGR